MLAYFCCGDFPTLNFFSHWSTDTGVLKPVHVICGEGIGEEGYGQLVIYKKCNAIEETSTLAKDTETTTETLNIVTDETHDDLGDDPILLEDDLDLINSQEIPKNIWGLIPSQGEYLIEIMKFTGTTKLTVFFS